MCVGGCVEGLVATRRRQCGVSLVVAAAGSVWWVGGDKVQVAAALFLAVFSCFALWLFAAGCVAALRAYFSRPCLENKVSQPHVSRVPDH